ncbi:hypothetical protein TPY_3198 [Sulfobacillus acidophilus TPY]|uniref:Uncharacterized protein n=1 Tax=Sulfobacillus acidophilus (strain ATCC 700253 / DSM 10332 / NAL) TaxID=679936 RepID=G8TZH0_SULAD|nr:hypothetical protein TPY_3198 [Sulfobacillus acidophilus TPY]AEW05210.1 hypothetical protein Sulac_1714 [Sulfobacillus acidophilus DSM 10332]
MNLEALYGAGAAATLSRDGATALSMLSLQALPNAVSPLDTQKAIQQAKQQAADAWGNPLMFVLVAALILWAMWRW